jgi:AmmeMemoRadiSam system protein B
MEVKTRNAVFANRFYPGSKTELEALIQHLLRSELDKLNFEPEQDHILGAIVPHAGYSYSGYHAIHAYQLLKISEQQFQTVVIVNPNHTGQGSSNYNLSDYNQWETPLGNLPVDLDFMSALNIEINNKAHENEHSGEVQLPLLRYFLPYDFKIVMITMNHQNIESAAELGAKIDTAVKETGKKVILLASCDFNHFENATVGFKKDQYVIDEILRMNPHQIYQQVKNKKVSTCGYGPVMTLIEYAQRASSSPLMKLLRRGNSGEVHPSNEVVDYASFLCYE